MQRNKPVLNAIYRRGPHQYFNQIASYCTFIFRQSNPLIKMDQFFSNGKLNVTALKMFISKLDDKKIQKLYYYLNKSGKKKLNVGKNEHAAIFVAACIERSFASLSRHS